MNPLYEDAVDAGFDAGDRSAQHAGRAAWNVDDWNAAAAEYDRVRGLTYKAIKAAARVVADISK